jgi:hypothetical protein
VSSSVCSVSNVDNIVYAYMINVLQNTDIYHRYPNQLSTSLAKLGGLLALLKIASFLLNGHHQKLFENQFKSDLSLAFNTSITDNDSFISKMNKPFKEVFTYQHLFESLKEQSLGNPRATFIKLKAEESDLLKDRIEVLEEKLRKLTRELEL